MMTTNVPGNIRVTIGGVEHFGTAVNVDGVMVPLTAVRALASSAQGASQEGAPSVLMRFYSVDTLEALVEAQARHIEKLQAKLPPLQPAFTRTPREG